MKLFLEFGERLIPIIESPISYISQSCDWKNKYAEEPETEYSIYLTLKDDKVSELDWYVNSEQFDSREEMQARWNELKQIEI